MQSAVVVWKHIAWSMLHDDKPAGDRGGQHGATTQGLCVCLHALTLKSTLSVIHDYITWIPSPTHSPSVCLFRRCAPMPTDLPDMLPCMFSM